MNKAMAIVSVVLSVAALGVALFRPSPGPTVEPAHLGALEPSPTDDARLVSLEMAVERLQRRVDLLERAPAAAAAPVAPDAPMTTEQVRRELAALRTEVDALATGEPIGTEDGKKRLKEVVRSLQDEMFAERAREHVNSMEQNRSDRIKKFVEEARLSPTQAQDLTNILADEQNKRRDLWDQRRGGTLAADPREAMRTLRQKTDEAAKGLLSEDQFSQYQTMRREERGGRGPRPGAESARP